MKITKREIIASVSIIAVMLIIGFTISEAIQQNLLEKYQVYDTAVKIYSEELFKYGMETNVGHAFVYGQLKTVDPVTFPEIEGKYSYIKKEEQEYTEHTRTYTETYVDEDGNTHTTVKTETYWSWDTMRTEEKEATKISFLNVEFEYSKIPFSYSREVATVKTGYHKRNVYYGKPTDAQGTIFTVLKNNTISETDFYNGKTIAETVEELESGFETVIFWICWILLTGGAVGVFFYLENKWLHQN